MASGKPIRVLHMLELLPVMQEDLIRNIINILFMPYQGSPISIRMAIHQEFIIPETEAKLGKTDRMICLSYAQKMLIFRNGERLLPVLRIRRKCTFPIT